MVERHGRTATCRAGAASLNLRRGERRGGSEPVEKSLMAVGEWQALETRAAIAEQTSPRMSPLQQDWRGEKDHSVS